MSGLLTSNGGLCLLAFVAFLIFALLAIIAWRSTATEGAITHSEILRLYKAATTWDEKALILAMYAPTALRFVFPGLGLVSVLTVVGGALQWVCGFEVEALVIIERIIALVLDFLRDVLNVR